MNLYKTQAAAVILVVIAGTLHGCTAFFYTPQTLRSDNRAHLSLLQIGMTKEEVMNKMGTTGKEACNLLTIFPIWTSTELVNNPYRTAGLQADGKT